MTIVAVERGEDLLALALLMATLSDWLVICQRTVPVVWRRRQGVSGREAGEGGAYTEAWRQHAGRDDEVGDDEAGHAEGQEDRLAGVCYVRRQLQVGAHVELAMQRGTYLDGSSSRQSSWPAILQASRFRCGLACMR